MDCQRRLSPDLLWPVQRGRSPLAQTFSLLAAAVTIAAASAPAFATHKNWVLRNTGSQCAFATPGLGTDNHSSGTFNGASYARFANCPVSLSARWGSTSSPSFAPPLSGAAMSAVVYVVNNAAGQELYCMARARMGSGGQLGSLYYNRTVTRTAGGDGLVSVAYGSDWAETMEPNQALTMRSLDLECRIPANFSGVYAYKAQARVG